MANPMRVLMNRLALLCCCVLPPVPLLALPLMELEPNDLNASANPLPPGISARGTILSGGEYDGWVIPNVRQGDLYYILLSAITDSGDPVLTLMETAEIASGTTGFTYFDDDSGPDSAAFDDSLLAGFPAKRTGAAVLRVDGFGSSTLNPYEIFAVLISPNEIVPEVEPNNSPAEAMPITAPAILAQGSDEDDYFSFHVNAGERIVVMVDQDPGKPDPGSLFRATIQVFLPDGVTDITSVVAGTFIGDNNNNTSTSHGFGAVPAPNSGTYFLRIKKTTGDDGDYRVVVLVEGNPPVSGACCYNESCQLTSAGNCRGAFAGAGTVCDGDDDGDGIVNDCDNCGSVANLSQEDTDLDEVGNACDSCPADDRKIIPGACGCGTQDTDGDGDGAADCNDQCPADSSKTSAGGCGCGVADTDVNSNGVVDCNAGGDIKASIQALLTALNGVKPAKPVSGKKVKAINLIRNQIKAVLTTSGAQITANQADFNITQQVNRLVRAAGAALKGSEGSRASNKRTAVKVGEKLLAVING
ncbi:MAG: PPC domain-containing protein [Bdellovibrionota bacterium]|nr:MAG: PPC domain-containing protein [Bdellovibrionota bacterium]